MAIHSTQTGYSPPVGACLLAKGVNDDAFILDHRGAIETFASRLAPTGTGIDQIKTGAKKSPTIRSGSL
ncbi:hypothetical protein D3C73_1529390 [compost metagenome]